MPNVSGWPFWVPSRRQRGMAASVMSYAPLYLSVRSPAIIPVLMTRTNVPVGTDWAAATTRLSNPATSRGAPVTGAMGATEDQEGATCVVAPGCGALSGMQPPRATNRPRLAASLHGNDTRPLKGLNRQEKVSRG